MSFSCILKVTAVSALGTLQTCRQCHPIRRSVCLSVRWVNCGKTAYCIWMPFGVVSLVGRRGPRASKGEILGEDVARIHLNGVFLTEMCSTRGWKVDNISVYKTIYH